MDAHSEKVERTIARHIAMLRELASVREISETEHDEVGLILCQDIGRFIGWSPKAWETFKRIVEESREVHYGDRKTERHHPETPATEG